MLSVGVSPLPFTAQRVSIESRIHILVGKRHVWTRNGGAFSFLVLHIIAKFFRYITFMFLLSPILDFDNDSVTQNWFALSTC